MQYLTASDGVRLGYVVDDFTDPWKPPETLVLLHAAMGSSKRLYAWVPRLARDFRVVRLDLRGHGSSQVPDDALPFTLDRLARDVIDLLDHLGLDRVHLAGSSAGAIISMKVAIDYPDRLLTLADFASTPGLGPSNVDAERWVAHISGRACGRSCPRPSPIASIWARSTRASSSGSSRSRRDERGVARPVRPTDALRRPQRRSARIRCPMLAVVPDHDPICSMAQYEVIRERMPNIEFMVYRGLPHNITDAVPDRCAEELHSSCSSSAEAGMLVYVLGGCAAPSRSPWAWPPSSSCCCTSRGIPSP